MKKGNTKLTVENRGKVIWQKLYKGKATITEALNYIDSIGLCAVEYCLCGNGQRIILAMTEDEF